MPTTCCCSPAWPNPAASAAPRRACSCPSPPSRAASPRSRSASASGCCNAPRASWSSPSSARACSITRGRCRKRSTRRSRSRCRARRARAGGRGVPMPGVSASLALEQPMADFIRDYPEVALELDLSPRRVDLIGENFDLAIRMGALPDDAQLAARRLATFTTGLYAAPSLLREHGEPLAPEALRTMPALLLLARSGDPVPWTLSRREATSVDAQQVATPRARR